MRQYVPLKMVKTKFLIGLVLGTVCCITLLLRAADILMLGDLARPVPIWHSVTMLAYLTLQCLRVVCVYDTSDSNVRTCDEEWFGKVYDGELLAVSWLSFLLQIFPQLSLGLEDFTKIVRLLSATANIDILSLMMVVANFANRKNAKKVTKKRWKWLKPWYCYLGIYYEWNFCYIAFGYRSRGFWVRVKRCWPWRVFFTQGVYILFSASLTTWT